MQGNVTLDTSAGLSWNVSGRTTKNNTIILGIMTILQFGLIYS